MSAQWWLDEHAHAGQEHLDPAYVAHYERKAGFDPGEAATRERSGFDIVDRTFRRSAYGAYTCVRRAG